MANSEGDDSHDDSVCVEFAQLLELNLNVGEQIEAGEAVTAPGVPPDFPNPDSLITEDCFRP